MQKVLAWSFMDFYLLELGLAVNLFLLLYVDIGQCLLWAGSGGCSKGYWAWDGKVQDMWKGDQDKSVF